MSGSKLGFSIHRDVEPDISSDEMPYDGDQYELTVTVENLSPQPAMYAIATIELPWPWVYLEPSDLENIGGPSNDQARMSLPDGRGLANSTRVQDIWSSTTLRSHGHPIFRGRAFDFFSVDVLAPRSIAELPTRWTIEAPHMQPIGGWAFIAPGSGRAEINPDRLNDRIELWLDCVQQDADLMNRPLRPNVIELPRPLDNLTDSLQIPPLLS